jgi:type II secretory pathway component PulK
VQYYLESGMTAEEFAKVQDDLSVTNAPFNEGLININTASQEVLATLPGIGTERAPQVVAYRQSHASELTSVAWITKALNRQQAIQVGPYITSVSHQFTADIAAVGHHGRGYRRVQVVIDDTEGTPKILYRRDLTDLGWALGQQIRATLLAAHNTVR